MGEGPLEVGKGIRAVNVKQCKNACKTLGEDDCHGFEFKTKEAGKPINCKPFHLKKNPVNEFIKDAKKNTYILRSVNKKRVGLLEEAANK